MQTILNKFRRLRHSHGFGIHSPFAFAFIDQVLTQPLPYYGYADISADRRVRLLFRLTAYFRPTHVRVLSAQPRLLTMAVRRASSEVVFGGDRPQLIVADCLDFQPDDYMPLINNGANALILNCDRQTEACIAASLVRGMIFNNGHGTLVAVPREGLPRQDFDVRF